jgi:hypothetical protein
MPGTSAIGTNSNNNGEVAMSFGGTTLAHSGNTLANSEPQSCSASTRTTYVCGPSLPSYNLRSYGRLPLGDYEIPCTTSSVARTTAGDIYLPRSMATSDSDETSLMYCRSSTLDNAHTTGAPTVPSYHHALGELRSMPTTDFRLPQSQFQPSANIATREYVNPYMMDTMQQLAASVNQLTASMTHISTTVSGLSHEVNNIRNTPTTRESVPYTQGSRPHRQLSGEPAAKVSLPLPKFTGKGDFVSFEAHFKNVAYQSRWSDDTSAVMLSCALEAQAQKFYARLPEPERYNYQWLLQTLGKRFSKSCPDVQKEALLGRVRQSNESMAELRDDIWRLVQESYPDMDYSFQEMIALDSLKRAVDQQLRLRFIDKDVQTLQEAVDVAEIYESVMRSSTSIRKTVRAVKSENPTVRQTVRFEDEVAPECSDMRQEMSTIQTTLQGLQKAVDALTMSSDKTGRNMSYSRSPSPNPKMSRNNPGFNKGSRSPYKNQNRPMEDKGPASKSSVRESITCFRCGNLGHWANECMNTHTKHTDQGNGQPPAQA